MYLIYLLFVNIILFICYNCDGFYLKIFLSRGEKYVQLH